MLALPCQCLTSGLIPCRRARCMLTILPFVLSSRRLGLQSVAATRPAAAPALSPSPSSGIDIPVQQSMACDSTSSVYAPDDEIVALHSQRQLSRAPSATSSSRMSGLRGVRGDTDKHAEVSMDHSSECSVRSAASLHARRHSCVFKTSDPCCNVVACYYSIEWTTSGVPLFYSSNSVLLTPSLCMQSWHNWSSGPGEYNMWAANPLLPNLFDSPTKDAYGAPWVPRVQAHGFQPAGSGRL